MEENNNVVPPAEKPAVSTPPKQINFENVEALRKHMLMTINNMAELLGVSRVTYYSWRKGGNIRGSNAQEARSVIRRLAIMAVNKTWPTSEVFVATQEERLAMLKDRLKEIDQQSST